MKSKLDNTSETVENILQVTKNTIQLNENYYNYYINKDNALYQRQLPLLIQKSNMQAIAIKRKENEKNYIDSDGNQDNSDIINKIQLPLNNIRNAQIRSKKLPPLCPFYSSKGELLRSVVTTSKILNKQFLTEDIRNTSPNRLKTQKINYRQTDSNVCNTIPSSINFDDFQNDYFYEPEHSSLSYKDYEIFGKKDYYLEFIKNKIEEFKKNEINGDKEYQKEKNFDKNKQKKNITLTFDSISVKIYEIKKEQQENKNENINESPKKNRNSPIFEYHLPFKFLPLFYHKGEEKFKIFLSKIIQWDNVNNKFTLNENPEKIFIDILKHCADFNKVEKKEEPKKEVKNNEEPIRPNKVKFSLTVGGKKSMKKDIGGFKYSAMGSSLMDEKALAQSMISPNPNTYLTNIDDSKKKFDVVFESSIYPSKKDHNYINFNIFEFLWITPNQNFKVCINTPLASISIPKNTIHVKKYIDFELLFYLYERNFENWDFFLIKYLSGFKSFRTLLEEINSINECFNRDFYLTQPRIKNYSFNNIKIINIASIKQKDILDNLIEGLMGIPEEKNEEQKDEKEKDDKKDKEKDKKKEKNIKNEEKEKVDIKDENKEEKENKEVTGDKNEENKGKEDENKKVEGDNKKDDEKNKTEAENKKEENNEKDKVEVNIINESNDDLINSTFIQKCFIALIRFVDTKTFKANEYKIYFNFNQFQKFQKMEKYIDKISFLIKFVDIDYIQKSVTIDYKSLDNFDENKWIKDFNKYNTQYLETESSKQNNGLEYRRMTAEYLGMTKNSIIQIEIYTPISLARTLSEIGLIKTDKIFMTNNYQDKFIDIKKDNIIDISKIFYDSYEEEQNKKA